MLDVRFLSDVGVIETVVSDLSFEVVDVFLGYGKAIEDDMLVFSTSFVTLLEPYGIAVANDEAL